MVFKAREKPVPGAKTDGDVNVTCRNHIWSFFFFFLFLLIFLRLLLFFLFSIFSFLFLFLFLFFSFVFFFFFQSVLASHFATLHHLGGCSTLWRTRWPAHRLVSRSRSCEKPRPTLGAASGSPDPAILEPEVDVRVWRRMPTPPTSSQSCPAVEPCQRSERLARRRLKCPSICEISCAHTRILLSERASSFRRGVNGLHREFT